MLQGGKKRVGACADSKQHHWRSKKMRNSLSCGKFLWIFPSFSARVHENKI